MLVLAYTCGLTRCVCTRAGLRTCVLARINTFCLVLACHGVEESLTESAVLATDGVLPVAPGMDHCRERWFSIARVTPSCSKHQSTMIQTLALGTTSAIQPVSRDAFGVRLESEITHLDIT